MKTLQTAPYCNTTPGEKHQTLAAAKIGIRALFCALILIVGQLTATAPARAERDGVGFGIHPDDSLSDSSVEVKPKTRPFKGYGHYKDELKLICHYLELDARKEKFYEIMVAHTEKDPDCVACRPLFKALALPCKTKPPPKPPKKPKIEPTPTPEATPEEGASDSSSADSSSSETESTDESGDAAPTPTPTPTPLGPPKKQREPSPALLDLISRLFITVSEEREDVIVEHLKGVTKLAEVLRTAPGTPGERDYFGILAEYIYAPFIGIARAEERAKEKGPEIGLGNSGPKGENPDSMFDF